MIGMAGESNAAVRRVCRRIDAFDEAGLHSRATWRVPPQSAVSNAELYVADSVHA